MVATKELDIIAITETWLNPEIMDQEILSSDYNIYRRDRLGKGGGVLLALRDNICCLTSKRTVNSISIPAQHTLLEYTTAPLSVIWPT